MADDLARPLSQRLNLLDGLPRVETQLKPWGYYLSPFQGFSQSLVPRLHIGPREQIHGGRGANRAFATTT